MISALALSLGSLSLVASVILGDAPIVSAAAAHETPSAMETEKADGRPSVITTTEIIADLARHVAGERMFVKSLVPKGGDPHSFEPSLRDVRDIVYSDMAFTNYMLLEEQNLIRAIDANLPASAPNISLAEEASKYGANLIPLIENINLDTIWLGLRVRGSGKDLGMGRAAEVRLNASQVEGPGKLFGYVTGSFGTPELFFSPEGAARKAPGTSGGSGGVGAGYGQALLPMDAHMHMSWAFTKPGVYRLHLGAEIAQDSGDVAQDTGARGVVTFAVGVEPSTVLGGSGDGAASGAGAGASTGAATGGAKPTVLDIGHADISVNLDTGAIEIYGDDIEGRNNGNKAARSYEPSSTVISVPSKALADIPKESSFRFLGRAGEQVYQLPQAVLGKHVHGEIDPHLWHDVANAKAYVKIIRDVMSKTDRAGAQVYAANAQKYLQELDELDAHMRASIASIPEDRRYLVTTHDAYGYLANAYGLKVAGFATPNPGVEASVQDIKKLTQTLRDLHVPAVFLEPNLAVRSSQLSEIASTLGVRVCKLYGDAFDDQVSSYAQMMRANARSLSACLGGLKTSVLNNPITEKK